MPDDRVPKKVGKRLIADWFKLVKKISTKKAKGILAPQHFSTCGGKAMCKLICAMGHVMCHGPEAMGYIIGYVRGVMSGAMV